jgi:hypothetical protein
MITLKKKIFYITLGIMLLLGWIFYSYLYQQTHPTVTDEKYLNSENFFRISYLNEVYKSVLKYIKITKKNPHSLFTVASYMYSKDNKVPFYIKVYGTTQKLWSEEILKSEKEFNSIVEYKLVRINDKDDWGVIELKPGKRGKYFFLITQTGSVYRILPKKEFLQSIKTKSFPSVPLEFLRRSFQADQNFVIPQNLATEEFKHMNYDHQIIFSNNVENQNPRPVQKLKSKN